MAKNVLSPSTLPLTPLDATLASLRTLATTPNPDARLVVACERFMVLTDEAYRLHRGKGSGRMDRIRFLMNERDRLEVEIAKTPARTQMGRLAKAELALKTMGKDVEGTIWAIPCSILKDFVRDASTRNEPWEG